MPKGYKLHKGDPVDSLEGIRPLTTKERSMVQTFPEEFDFSGTKTDDEQMIGNAVPVELGHYIANAIVRYAGEEPEHAVQARPVTATERPQGLSLTA